MVNFPITSPLGNTALPTSKPAHRQVAPSGATENREMTVTDRRRMKDRRSRRGGKQVMDRRIGTERRRSSIDLSV